MNRLGAHVVNLLLLGALLVVVGVGYSAERDARIEASESARMALCSLRADIQRRYDAGVDYIDDLKAGRREPLPGITIADLRRSVDGQRSTLEALKSLDCR